MADVRRADTDSAEDFSAAEFMLQQWGIWSRISLPGPREYTSSAGKIHQMLVQQTLHESSFLIGEETAESVDRAVSASPGRARSVLKFRYVYGYKISEMAAIFGCAIGEMEGDVRGATLAAYREA